MRLASQAAEEVIIGFVVVTESAAAQPTGHGFASLSEEHAGEDRQQPPCQPGMQSRAQVHNPQRQFQRQLPLCHPWLSCFATALCQNRYRGRRATYCLCRLTPELFSESAIQLTEPFFEPWRFSRFCRPYRPPWPQLSLLSPRFTTQSASAARQRI